MNETQDLRDKMRAITISREYGSGGGEIARRLAHNLHWQLIDHDIVQQVAREVQSSEQEAEDHDEQTEDLLTRVFRSFQSVDPPVLVHNATSLVVPPQIYRNALRKVVNAAAAKGHVVIVGRASQVLLASCRDILHVRVVAPLEKRVTYVQRREGLKQEEALARIQKKDRDRLHYVQSEFKQRPEDAHLYDLTVNTATLSLDQIVRLLCDALQYKAEQLSLSQEELGPGAGVPRYPERPEDFSVPEPEPFQE
jgi:CMP/dCMP kinase